jgi:hypothetical protein
MWAMTISLKRPITRLKKTDAIMIREAMPTFLDKDLVMEVLTGCHGLSGDTVYPQIFYPKLIGSRFQVQRL